MLEQITEQEDGSSSSRRRLIVNADDFGLSPGVNRGIVEAYERGIVTSASLMVRWAAAAAAADYGREREGFSLGLHFDLFEWAYRGGEWIPLYEVAPADDADAVARELSSQLDAFRRLVGRNPTHLDSHQHAHRSEPVRSALIEASRKLDVPLRHFSQTVRYDGNFYGQTGTGEPYPQAISRDSLVELLKALPTGVTELGCHPAYNDGLDSMYTIERADEVKVLCDPLVKATLAAEGIELISFSDVSGK